MFFQPFNATKNATLYQNTILHPKSIAVVNTVKFVFVLNLVSLSSALTLEYSMFSIKWDPI